MVSRQDNLQERLEWLEAGKPLEECIEDLSEEESELLKKAAQLRGFALPERDAETAAKQRRVLIRSAKEGARMSEKTKQEKIQQTSPRKSNRYPRWAFPAAIVSVLTVITICGMVTTAVLGSYAIRLAREGDGVFGPDSDAFSGAAAEEDLAQVFEAPDAESAVLINLKGIIEKQEEGATWTQVHEGAVLAAGDRLRTGALSSVTLAFYDGSEAYLGPNAEVSIDMLDAQRAGEGPRVVSLTQWLGESRHDVSHSDDPGSVYEVNTPAGTGTAKGTEFTVTVTTTLVSYFSVDEGSIAVAGVNVTMIVVAGQTTTVDPGGEPQQPVFTFEGQGEVESAGASWIIAGYFFTTNEDTVVIGNPQPGDWVAFKGRISPNGSRVLTRVVLVERASENAFSLTGGVEAMGESEWVVAGQAFTVDGQTAIKDDIAVGDTVNVEGVILEDGSYLAEKVSFVDPEENLQPFEFTGVVEQMGTGDWVISGKPIATDENTTIEGLIEVGDLAKVEGNILEDGTWLAEEIELAEEDDEREFEFSGVVESTAPWVVSGISFETDERTDIDEGIEVGADVKVEGVVLEDGTWLAKEIEAKHEDEEEDELEAEFEFTGPVESMAPWVVAGFEITVDDSTEIEGDISVGDIVKVEGHILEDGTWLADEIKRVDNELGCMDLASTVLQANSDSLVLFDFSEVDLDDDEIEIEDEDDIQVATVVILHICVSADDGIVIQSIIIVFQLDALPVYIIEHDDDDHDHDDDDDDHEEDDD